MPRRRVSSTPTYVLRHISATLAGGEAGLGTGATLDALCSASRARPQPGRARSANALLMGERAIRFAPNGVDFVDVCPLCQEQAVEYGWLKGGSPTTPTVPESRRRRRQPRVDLRDAPARLRDDGRARADPPPSVRAGARDGRGGRPLQLEPVPAHGRRDREEPRSAARVDRPALGVKSELVVTVVWDISWYQYRVSLESAQPVRLAERGHDPRRSSTARSGQWNAHTRGRRPPRSGHRAPLAPANRLLTIRA